MRPLRVLHVIPSVSVHDGGPSAAIRLMERSLGACGVEVTTLTTDHGLDIAFLEHSRKGWLANCDEPRRIYAHMWFTAYKVAPGLVTWLSANIKKYDLVHIHALFSFAPTVAAWIARAAGLPYVIRPVGALTRYGMTDRRRLLKRISLAAVERSNLAHAAAVHFTARVELEEAQAQGVKCRGVVIPIGVKLDKKPPAYDLRGLNPLLANRVVMLFLSRIDRKKNLEALIDAFAASRALRETAALVVAGSGPPEYIRSLKLKAEASGVDACMTWLGHVGGGDKAAAFAAADLFVLPSFSENFGIAAVEAMFAGLPCVLGEGVAVAREAEEAGAAVSVAPECSALVRVLEWLTRAADVRVAMSSNARTYAEQHYSTTAMAQRLIELYEDIRT